MTKKAVFEVATFVDAVKKANRVAPTKGSALDRSAGIVIEVDPNLSERVVMKATDLEVTLRMVVNALEVGDEACRWRIPSRLLFGIINTLSIASGNQIELVDTGDGEIYFRCGKTKAKIRQIRGDYPLIGSFDASQLDTVDGLSQRLNQVAWATDRQSKSILSGVHMDGTRLVACDRSRLAIVPCAVPVSEPITAPLWELAAVIRNTQEVAIGADENRVLLMPDDYTQATSVLLKGDYANFEPLLVDKTEHELTVPCEALSTVLDRTLVLAKEERETSTNITFGDGCVTVDMQSEIGKVVDELEIEGGHTGEPLKMRFDAEMLRKAIDASGRPRLKIRYGPHALAPVRITDDDGFFVLMMPMAGAA